MTNKTIRALCLPLLALLAAACTSDVRGGDATIRFTAIPGENTTEMIEKFGAVADYLSAELGVPFEYVHVADYGASVEAFKNGDVHLSWFGGLTGVRARAAVPGARAIAQGKIDPKYKSYFIANADSGLEASESFPEGLNKHSFTFGSDSSTSGRLMPEYFIRKATGKTPAEYFGSEMNFSGSHDQTWQLVQSGSFDAGVLSYKTYETRVKEGKIDPEVCRIIWITPPYPDYSWNSHPALDIRYGKGFTDRVQKTLTKMGDPVLLGAMMREEGLIDASNEEFKPLEDLARQLGLVR
jgi:phosphonate transport system substrate-binding protein